MFGLGMSEIMLILALALIIIGPKKLPEVAKAVGKGYAEFKKALNDFKESVNISEELKDEPKHPKKEELKEIYTEKWEKDDKDEKDKKSES